MASSNFIPVVLAVAVGVVTFQNWSAIKGMAASAGVDLSSAIGGVFPGMRLDPGARDVIEDRRGGPMGDLADRIGPESFPGAGYGPGRFPGGRYAQDGGPPMPPMSDGTDYQGSQGGDPPGRPPMPCPPGRSARRPSPGGPVSDDSDWLDDAHFGPQRGQGHWRDCGASGRRCGPWVDGPMPGDAIREDPKWRGR